MESLYLKKTPVDLLNFPEYEFRYVPGKIFDPVRKKFVALTPEEWVRQHVIRFLGDDRGYPLSLMAVEAQFELHTLRKRMDILVHGRDGKPLLIVECKAPTVKINQKSFDQAARYNLSAGVEYFFITNGLTHFFCKSDKEAGAYHFLPDMPLYSSLFPI
jgi:predicted type IV restriction endonuclease